MTGGSSPRESRLGLASDTVAPFAIGRQTERGYGGSSPREIQASPAPDTMAPAAIGRQARRQLLQESLLDFGDDAVPGALRPERVPLSRGAWIDVQRGWLSGSAALFGRLAADVPWRAERRRMYDRTVDVPRLLCFYGADAALPDPALDACRDALNAHYAAELGEEFVTAGLCFYRDGRDSVAWHGDRIGRGATQDTMVAIVSLGEARPLLLRPAPGTGTGGEPGGTLRYSLGHGDLIVMGGSCQRTWEHAIPKSARPAGPRISVQFRPRGVR